MRVATITLGIDPMIEVGPLEPAWHGIMIAVGLAIAIPIARRHSASVGRDPDVVLGLAVIVELAYLDSLAFAFPAAMAVGRIGDLINGEHYGPAAGVAHSRRRHPAMEPA